MPIYIIQPQRNPASSLDLISTKLTTDSRQANLREVTQLWKTEPDYQAVRDWVIDYQQQKGVLAASDSLQPGITGVIVDLSEEMAEQLRQDLPNVWVLKDEPVPLIQPRRDTTTRKASISEEDLWHLDAIALTSARQNGYSYTGKGITIAVLDTGIDATHPELQGKVAQSYHLDVRTVAALGEPEEVDESVDSEGHGTHVAGLIGGNQVGVAPEARLINGLMLPGGVCSLTNFRIATDWLSTRTDIDIVNISAGMTITANPKVLDVMELYVETLLAIGILPICAVGNEGRNKTRSPGNCRSVVSVGASNRNHRVAGFSGSGSMVVDYHQYAVPSLVAPGEQVYSAVMGGQYEAWDGTSMATPLVSGIAALILEQYPDITVFELIDELLMRCEPLNAPTERQGAGVIQIGAA
jgi:subtilisin family serine protease